MVANKTDKNNIEKLKPRLKSKFEDEIVSQMVKEYKYRNKLMVPKILKTVVNVGLGEALVSSNVVQIVSRDLQAITGQKPIERKAKKSIANFKLREGMPIGCKVTLRKEKMYDFFEKLIKISLPRTRDFRGLNPNSFDGRGNYTLGIKEHIIFPEIDFDKIDKIKGLDICITTSAKNNEEAMELLKQFNFPFK